ncbi:hypothetical protein AMC99_00385 [Altererythrobacter epoxidivorans]|uniref:DUF885 domain-containing protein n=2 Tax=Altererythrobacter epoxidivorans TaxID=361183 RepID=A0A0M4LTG9_9SPHN|nr:hypothetical protein AMC99_00385 [Altererythrobacter epoxidivorans]
MPINRDMFMKIFRSAILASSALSLAACATTPMADTPVASVPELSPAERAAAQHDALFAVFESADEAELALSPLGAMSRGDLSQADRIGDYYTDELTAASKALAEKNLAALGEIDRSALSETDRLAYDVFEFSQREALKSFAPDILAVSEVRPMNHFFGLHTYYPTIESGQGLAPFKTVKDYENAIGRHADYARIIDRAIGRFREGMDSGVLETKMTVSNMIEQLDTQLAIKVEESPFWTPITEMPEDISDADKARLTEEYRTSLQQVYRANRRLRDFLKDDYLPVARDSYGLTQMKGGAALYDRLIEESTTLPLSADYLHNLGLSEVARIRGEMEGVKEKMGFEGTLNEFFDYVRKDPKFWPASREALTEEYYRIGREVDKDIGDLFSLLPKTPLEIRPYEPFREKFEAGGSYSQGAPDGSRPGIFYFNAYDLPSRPITQNVTLYLHEGAPGHHFQISLAQENEALPSFMRFGGNTAYVEGWALYAETLGYEMGLFEDPIAHYGTLDDEMLRAIRLVVDTGIHSKGWSRQQAIDYMLANSSKGVTDATAEIERYIAIPGQALAYKVGALKIQELRTRAESKLGDDFDIKEFHAQVLDTGSLPLSILEQKIDRWIAAKKAS